MATVASNPAAEGAVSGPPPAGPPRETTTQAAGAALVGRLFGKRFAARSVLQSGPSVQTLAGVDLQEQPVVIKTWPLEAVPAAVQLRLEHEAGALRSSADARVVPWLEVGREHGLFYLVRPFQPGVPLADVLRQRQLSVEEALRLGQYLCAALEAAHQHGVLHRNLKPANVILDRAETLHQAVLVDFGWAHSLQPEATAGQLSLQAVRYVAPEQAGLLAGELAACSDLYSLGVVLFESLARATPFGGATVNEVLRQHMTLVPPELRRLGLPVPRALDEVVQRLLRKEPRERYQRAAAAGADLQAIRTALHRGESEPALVVGRQDARTTLTEPAFVGRSAELRQLDDQLQATRQGGGGLVYVEADSGGGKTRLLSEWTLGLGHQDVWVLHGQALAQRGPRPFAVLEGVAAEIGAAAHHDPQLAAELREHLGDSREAAGAALPQLAAALGTDPSRALGPEAFGETRSLDALALLLCSLGAGARPAVVVLDDCQWADELSLKLLQHWQNGLRSQRRRCRVMVVAAFRSEEVRDGHLLRGLPPVLHLRLPPFGEEQLRHLAESMAGTLPSDALQEVRRLSAGSPFMASAVLRGMVEAKALLPTDNGWEINGQAMNDLRSSRHAAELLARRIDLLPVVAVDLLKAAAVLGKEFELPLAANLAGLIPGHAAIGVRQAQQRHLVWTRSGEERWSFVHDKVREAFLDRLAADERRDLQLRAAQQLEQVQPPPIYELAYLFDAAGHSPRALPYALQAAAQARSQHALQVAAQQYRIAVRGAGEADHATRFGIAQGLGDVLMLRGEYDPACQMFEAAKFIAEDMPTGNIAKAEIEGKLGELAFKRGDMATAALAIEAGLRQLGYWVPDADDSCWRPLAKQVTIQFLHSVLPRWFVGRRAVTHADRESDLLAVRLYGRLGHAYWFTREKTPTLVLALLIMNLAERYPPTLELAQAYSYHAPVMTLIPWFGRAEAYARRSLEIRQREGDEWGQAQSQHFYGIVLYAASRFRDCIQRCRDAVRLFQRTGDYWEMNMARYQLAASLYRLGDLPTAVAEAKLLHKSGLELGDAQASGIALDIWSWASGGKVPEATLATELARKRNDKQATAQVWVAEGVRQLGLDQTDAAVAAFRRAWQAVEESKIINAWVAPVLPWLMTALRRQGEQLPSRTPARRAVLLQELERVGRRALRITRRFRNDLPHTLRELARLAAMQGQLGRARRLFDRSLREAERQGARYEAAQTRLARGQVGLEADWPHAAGEIQAAEQELDELRSGLEAGAEDSDSGRRPATLSLADRFDTVLSAGRAIASALSEEAIFRQVQDAALRLLRGDQCAIVPLAPDGGGGEPSAPAAASPPGAEREPASVKALLELALQAQRSVALGDSPEAEPGELLVTLGVRSAICTPIYVRGRPAACYYVTHRQLARTFRDDERRLADFIAAIAGAALENAAGFQALQRLNATLEQRVAERTADLEQRTQELARSNTELEQFAYVASHDLREPLRTIDNHCQMLQRTFGSQLPEEARQHLTQATAGAKRMRDLIHDLLAYSRVGTRGKPLEPTDCNHVLDLVLANLSVVIEETGAVITREPLPWVMGDATQLIQLFQNLIANALKFRGDQPPQVHLAAQARDGRWLFSVRDNGIGIPREHFQRIFMILQRLHGPKEYPGTGIGLAVCKKTVERHGGQIWVESEPGRGSVFWFSLPRCEPGTRTLPVGASPPAATGARGRQ